jgi:hypothetical protein
MKSNMNIKTVVSVLAFSCGVLAAVGCSDPAPIDPNPNSTTDSGTDTGTPGPGRADCATYCDVVTANCSGVNLQYTDKADCLAYCNSANWAKGVDGEQANNTVACRIYHGGVAKGDPATHCGHSGPSGDGVCGSVVFQNDPPSTFVRVDRMGMPAVATALIGAADKNAYNDANPEKDGADFAPKFIASLTAIHTALDANLTSKNLVPCSMIPLPGGLPECLAQEYAPGKTVASLVVPHDTLKLDLAAPPGFPNGRMLQDQVIDVTLGVLLLKLGPQQGADKLAKIPLNPGKNDINGGVFGTEFPYFLPPQK